jgi:hypothetical protein
VSLELRLLLTRSLQNQEQTDPEPQILYRSFETNENEVSILVSLFSSDSNMDDSYPKDHPKNYGKFIKMCRQCFVAHGLQVFRNGRTSISRWTCRRSRIAFQGSRKKTGPAMQNTAVTAQLRRSPREHKQTPKGPAATQQQSSKERRSMKQNATIAEQDGISSMMRSTKASRNDNISSLVDESIEEWHTVKFVFHMRIIGLLAHYILECPSAPPDKQRTEGSVSLSSWEHWCKIIFSDECSLERGSGAARDLQQRRG